MSTTTIKNVSLKNLSQFDAYKLIKTAINSNDAKQITDFKKTLLNSYETKINTELIPHLRSIFNFDIVDEFELEQENYYKELKLKREKASEWFNKLSPTEQGYAFLVCTPH